MDCQKFLTLESIDRWCWIDESISNYFIFTYPFLLRLKKGWSIWGEGVRGVPLSLFRPQHSLVFKSHISQSSHLQDSSKLTLRKRKTTAETFSKASHGHGGPEVGWERNGVQNGIVKESRNAYDGCVSMWVRERGRRLRRACREEVGPSPASSSPSRRWGGCTRKKERKIHLTKNIFVFMIFNSNKNLQSISRSLYTPVYFLNHK